MKTGWWLLLWGERGSVSEEKYMMGGVRKHVCQKQCLSSFSMDTVVPVCEVWSSGSYLVTMRAG